MEKTPVVIAEERLNSVLASLEECRTTLVESGSHETALLVSVAILELRMKLNRIVDSELKALCDALLLQPPEASPPMSESQGRERGALLKLVK
jgi:hypothetical protein